MRQRSDTTPILLAWSGGKDCLMALDRLHADPRWQVTGLLTTTIRSSGRVASHAIRAEVLHAQAHALDLPLFESPIDEHASNTDYLAAFAAALAQAREHSPSLQHIAFGDLALTEVRAWREAELARLGWHGLFPLWGEATSALARQFMHRGHHAWLSCVDGDQLDASFAGRAFDTDLLRDLPAHVDPCGENGEFHTLVHASPLFTQAIPLLRGERLPSDGRFHCVDFQLA